MYCSWYYKYERGVLEHDLLLLYFIGEECATIAFTAVASCSLAGGHRVMLGTTVQRSCFFNRMRPAEDRSVFRLKLNPWTKTRTIATVGPPYTRAIGC